VSLPKEELHGLLKLIAKRFDETEQRLTEQDLTREGIRMLLAAEGLMKPAPPETVHASAGRDKRVQ